MNEGKPNSIVIKKGTELYHGTGEEFEHTQVRGGGYDGIFWTTTESAISQSYIPVAGLTTHTDTRTLSRPNRNKFIQNFQNSIGLEYDLSKVEFGYGDDVKSYYNPPLLQSLYAEFEKHKTPNTFYSDFWDKVVYKLINQNLEKLGYKSQNSRFDNNHRWSLKIHDDKIMSADWRLPGRLFIVKPKRDMTIWDNTAGGSVEGDLTDPEYHHLNLFQVVEKQGYDGIKINDYAQIEDTGNFGHHSIGFFENALKDLDVEVIDNVVHPQNFFDKHAMTNDYASDEYKQYKSSLKEVKYHTRKLLLKILNY